MAAGCGDFKAEPGPCGSVIMTEIADLKKLYDVVVIGGGPAGLTAALYLARARYRVLVLEKEGLGGQITITSEVVNYPGVKKTSGAELTEVMRRQAQDFGAEFLMAEARGIDPYQDVKTVHTSRGDINCFGVLLAAGAQPRKIGFDGEEEFKGRGVAYCATCDGEFFAGKEVFVVGGGFAAAEESVFLTKYARHVTVLIRGDDFKCAKTVSDAARRHEKITVITNVQVESVTGDSFLESIRYQNTKTGEITEYNPPKGESFGVFVFAGYEPATQIIKGIAELNDQGYVVTGRDQKTNIEGLYAAGDVCVKNLRQVVTAVGDGALAATELEKYAALLQQKTGLYPISKTQQSDVEEKKMVKDDSKKEEIFSAETKSQLHTVFEKMEQPLVLKLFLNKYSVSAELEQYMRAMEAMTDKLSVLVEDDQAEDREAPYVRIFRADGSDSGIAFHGVPGGHEFTSFVLGLYNASGPGQELDPAEEADIRSIHKPIQLKILVSLSCTMCPELVTAAQRIAAGSPFVSAEVYDLNHFPDLKERFQVMSVPCLVVNDKEVSFGKKNVRKVLDIITKI